MNDSIIKDTTKTLANMLKKTKAITLISGLSVVVLILIVCVVMLLSMKNFSFEVKEAKLTIEKGINSIQQEAQRDEGHRLSLKEDAFSVIDDTEIILDDGLDDIEIETALDNHKYGNKTMLDGNLSDQKENSIKFDEIWGIEHGVDFDINTVIDDGFINRLEYMHEQHIYRIDWKYFNQRTVPKIGNVVCVPSSAVFLLNALDCDVTIYDVLKYFTDNKKINDYARKLFGDWINEYIKNNKLYQITGTFTYGLNLLLEEHYPDFQYRIDYDYWSVNEIADYVESFGLMSATFLPNWVLKGERTGGHMVVISKVYRDFEGNVIAFGLNDPFGNPNVKYKNDRGWDGKNVIISIDDMLTVMKSYRDDHNRGSKYLYRILFFKDKEE